MFSQIDILRFVFWILALFISITFHEFMHAWTANYLGDPTPKAAGRVTLNPIAHIDPFGTILLPFVLILLGAPAFGYAKPVPINPLNFKNYRIGEALTSLAGPLANLMLILVFSIVYKVLPIKESLFAAFVLNIMIVNIVLMVFNLIPIPPLDGSKVLYSILPSSVSVEKFEVYGPFFLIPFIIIFAPRLITPIVSFILHLLGIPLNLY
jgi:Zn-dependent protease